MTRLSRWIWRFVLLVAMPMLTYASYEAATTAVERGDYQQALNELQPLLKSKDKNAQYLIGLMYFQGLGVRRDLDLAIGYLQQATDQGHEYARLLLGVSLNAKGEFSESAKHLQWAADKNEASAQYLLGMMYVGGRGVPQDINKALQLFRAAHDQNYTAATTKLAQFYYGGLGGLKKNPLEAARLFRLAAEKGEHQAQLLLGEALYNGEGVAANPTEAVSWFIKAANAGQDPEAYARLGWAYHEGKGVIQNDFEAAKWMKVGADGGSAFAQLVLGTFYRDGVGVEKNLVTGLVWMRLALAQGYSGATEQIQHIMSFMSASAN